LPAVGAAQIAHIAASRAGAWIDEQIAERGQTPDERGSS
jgi:hypothetical protein